VFRGEVGRDDLGPDDLVVVELPATDLAVDVGNIMTASVVMVGGLAALTGLVTLDALLEAVPQALPPYRTKHVELNRDALRAGFDAVGRDLHPAWTSVGAA
jgi:2-oxoglutarate ferredoxin oxidoreductase subunit gamma